MFKGHRIKKGTEPNLQSLAFAQDKVPDTNQLQ
jgi:hypothetical protein